MKLETQAEETRWGSPENDEVSDRTRSSVTNHEVSVGRSP